MKLQIEVIKRKTLITHNGITTEHKTTWIKNMTVNDLINTLEDETNRKV